jgi:hypothetical protein
MLDMVQISNTLEKIVASAEQVPRVKWSAYLTGKPPANDLRNSIAFTLPDGKQPNWCNRQMQWFLLGIYWRKERRAAPARSPQRGR